MGPLSNYFLHPEGRQISFQWHPLTTRTFSQSRRLSSPYSSFCLPFSLYSHNLYPYLAVSLSSLFRPPFTPHHFEVKLINVLTVCLPGLHSTFTLQAMAVDITVKISSSHRKSKSRHVAFAKSHFCRDHFGGPAAP